MNQEFTPVFLYIKTHNTTGLKYFGKTAQKDPYKYRGSGTHWKRHIKKHGYDVTTEIIGLFDDKFWCMFYALEFSALNDIVASKEWANLKEESLDGGWDHINKNVTPETIANRIKNGKRLGDKGYITNKENCTGFFDPELQSMLGKRGGQKAKELGVGAIFGCSLEERDKNRQLSYTKEAREKHSRTANERRSYDGEKNSQHDTKFICYHPLQISFRVKYHLVPFYLDQGWNLGKFSNEYFSNGKKNKLN